MSELERELLQLYREVDALYEGARCEQSSECCRFGITGREPQVTALELALLRRALAQRGGPLSAKKRALPLTREGARERICPLLERPGRCAVYEARPLGCRTFFCSRAELPSRIDRRALSGFVRRLQQLAESSAPGGDKPRALSRCL